MPESNSLKVVHSGLIANVAIAICKFVAAGLTGSSAMLAEAFHSAADAGNEFLLWIGIRRSMRPPDALIRTGMARRFISIRCWSRFTSSESAEAWRCMRASSIFGIRNSRRTPGGTI